MSTRRWQRASKDLARIGFVLAPGRARRGWIAWSVLVIAALLLGAAGSHLYWSQRLGSLQQQAAAAIEVPQLQQALEQARLQGRMSDARSHELERQIDTLNQRLRESQEEITFFRKAGDPKH